MENQRIRISKTMLKEALIQLLEEKQISKISIYELCDRAKVNRTTFYKYYGSQYDLLEDIENDIFSELERLLPIEDEETDGLELALRYMLRERRKCMVFINSTPDKQFAEKLFSRPVVGAMLENQLPRNLSKAEKKYIRSFFCHGAYAIIVQWLNDEHPESIEEVAKLIYSLASSFFRA